MIISFVRADLTMDHRLLMLSLADSPVAGICITNHVGSLLQCLLLLIFVYLRI
jgi:hypothetical protein